MRSLITNTFFSGTAAPARPESTCATLSAFIPVYGLVIATNGFNAPDTASLIFTATSVIIGFSAAITAWVRREKSRGLIITGFVLNTCLFLCLLLMFIAHSAPE